MNTSHLKNGLLLLACGLFGGAQLGCGVQVEDSEDSESLEPVDSTEAEVNGCPGGGITVYEDAYLKGRSWHFCEGSYADLRQHGGGLNPGENWSDRISSIEAFGTYNRTLRVQLFHDIGYVGRFGWTPYSFTDDNHHIAFGWNENDRISSFKIEGSSNLIGNPSFEDPNNYYANLWHGWSRLGGDQPGKVELRASSDAYSGTKYVRIQHLFSTQCLLQWKAAKPGEFFSARVYARRYNGVATTQALTLSFYPYATDKAIKTVRSVAGSSTSWQPVTASGTAPANTAWVRLAIGACDQRGWTNSATYEYDAARLLRY
jgi:hypothetical protein